MRFANIVPVPFLERYGKMTDYHLALTHLVQSQGPAYIDFMRKRSKRGDFIIMDNSLIELGSAMKLVDVIEAASVCGAHEIVLPDVFLKKDETLEAIHRAISELQYLYGGQAKIPFQLMAVPQGKNFEEWLSCLHTILTTCPLITTIGIPKVTNTFYEGIDIGRIEVLNYLQENDIVAQYPNIQWHMLGVWNNPIEVKHASKFSWIRGCDTSIAWACSQTATIFDFDLGAQRPAEAVIDFNTPYMRDALLMNHNVATMISWARFYE